MKEVQFKPLVVVSLTREAVIYQDRDSCLIVQVPLDPPKTVMNGVVRSNISRAAKYTKL